MLPDGNIKLFSAEELFGFEQYAFAISGMQLQQIYKKKNFCCSASGSQPERVKLDEQC
jgi:hypothetical protein